jgi:hypothetical protein
MTDPARRGSLEDCVMRNAIHFLGGSVAVYLLMAACSAGSKGSSHNGPGMIASQGGNRAHAGDAAAIGGVTASSGGTVAGMIGDMIDPVDDAAAETKSGTRLRARYYVGEDGSKEFIGWHDMQRNENCTFAKAPDGKLRCLPSEGNALALGYNSDAGCTTQLFITIATGACVPPTAKYATTTDTSTCTTALHTVTLVTPTELYVGTPANCLKVTQPPAGYAYYASSGVLAPAEFVAATEQVE